MLNARRCTCAHLQDELVQGEDEETAQQSSSARSKKGRRARQKAPEAAAPVLSEYEQMRDENVAKNNKVLSTCDSSKCVPTGEVFFRHCV